MLCKDTFFLGNGQGNNFQYKLWCDGGAIGVYEKCKYLFFEILAFFSRCPWRNRTSTTRTKIWCTTIMQRDNRSNAKLGLQKYT